MKSYLYISVILGFVVIVGSYTFANPIASHHSKDPSSNPNREMGEFVKDIPIPNLEIQPPPIFQVKKGNRFEFYSLEGGFFPIEELDVYFYTGEFPDLPPETAPLLMETWKLGGTSQYPDEKFLERLEFLGIQVSWKPGYDKSILSLSFLEKDSQELEKLLEDWLLNPRLTEKNFAIAKSQLQEAIRRRNDQVTNLGIRKSKERFYEGHLRGRSESLESLEKVTLKELQEYYQRLMGTGLIRVLYSGLNRREETLKYWNGLIAKTQPRKLPNIPDINYNQWRDQLHSKPKDIHLIQKDTNQAMVVFTGIMPPHNHPDFYAIQLLNYILGGGGFNSYLMTEIRNNRGLAYSTVSYIQFEKTHGLFLAYTQTKNESLKEVIQLMEEILSSKKSSEITEWELNRAKNAIVNQFVFLFENRSSVLRNHIRFLDHEMPEDYLQKYRERIQSVKLSDIHRVGREYFSPGAFQITVVAPSQYKSTLEEFGRKVTLKDPDE